jgi:hypothetical protein
MPGIAEYRAELSRANVRRAWSYDREETIFVGPFVAAGVWVPFKVSRENRVVKGIAVPDAETLLNMQQPALTVNDVTARLMTFSELEFCLVRLADPDGVAYASDLPALRLIKQNLNGLDGPAPYNVHPMLTAMDGGGAVITNRALFGTGIDWYLPVTFFYDEGR